MLVYVNRYMLIVHQKQKRPANFVSKEVMFMLCQMCECMSWRSPKRMLMIRQFLISFFRCNLLHMFDAAQKDLMIMHEQCIKPRIKGCWEGNRETVKVYKRSGDSSVLQDVINEANIQHRELNVDNNVSINRILLNNNNFFIRKS